MMPLSSAVNADIVYLYCRMEIATQRELKEEIFLQTPISWTAMIRYIAVHRGAYVIVF